MEILLLLALAAQDMEKLRSDYDGLLRQEHTLSKSHEKARAESHALLDAGRNDAALARAEEARVHKKELTALGGELKTLRRQLARECLKALGADDPALRKRATRILDDLGTAIFPLLARALRSTRDREVLSRIQSLLKDCSFDTKGRLHQWAAFATASTQYAEQDWSAGQIVGPPNTAAFGDARTAWASKAPDGGAEWLKVEVRLAVRISRIRIHETFNPGAVTKIEALGEDDKPFVLWEGRDPRREWFEVPLTGQKKLIRKIRITLDTTRVAGWNEIDAVELVGELSADE